MDNATQNRADFETLTHLRTLARECVQMARITQTARDIALAKSAWEDYRSFERIYFDWA